MFACSCSNENSLDKKGKANLKDLLTKKKNKCCNSGIVTDNRRKKDVKQYLLVGAPNVGKSTFFNKITWQNAPVGNIDRITVSAKRGTLRLDSKISIIDLPGVYTLNPSTGDEEVVIKNVVEANYDSVLNIIAAPSLKRDLTLTIQLLEAGVVNDIAINMVDEVKHLRIDAFRISRKLGVPIHLISAVKNRGVRETVKSLLYDHDLKKPFPLKYEAKYETIISTLETYIPDLKNVTKRFIAIQYLEGNLWIHKMFYEWNIKQLADDILEQNGITIKEAKVSIRNSRNIFINSIYQDCMTPIACVVQDKKFQKSKKIDQFMTNAWIAIPIFLLVLAAIYYITFGSYAGGWITEKWTNLLSQGQDAVRTALANNTTANEWVQNFVADGLLGGIFTVVGFLPYIIILFFFVSLLEQTGYLARISLLTDKWLERFGISGRSVVTLITGIGCNIPSVMMARNCHSKKERTIVFLIAPFMACSARLVVFTWIAEALIGPNCAWLIGLGMTIFSGLVTLLLGLAFSQTMFRNYKTFLLTELPKWRMPDFLVIFKKLVIEVFEFLKRVITIIFLINLIMFLLMYISPTTGLIMDDSYLNVSVVDLQHASLLQYISLPFQYLFYPIGLGQDWRFATSLIAAAPAKELAASNLALMFTGNSNDANPNTYQGLHDALFGPNSNITLPIATISAYLVFFAFYTPCLSTIVVMKKEGGWKKTGLHLLTAFFTSYSLALFFYVGIGSIEKCVLSPVIADNGFMISAWIIFAMAIAFIFIPYLIRLIQDWKQAPAYQNVRQVNLVCFFSGLGFIYISCVLALIFMFAY